MNASKPRFFRIFLLFSLLLFISIIVFRFFFSTNFSDFGMNKFAAVFLSSILTYNRLLPYTLALSLYMSYWDYRISAKYFKFIYQKTFSVAFVSVVFYASMTFFLSSSILTNINNIYLSERYRELYQFMDIKSNEVIEEARNAYTAGEYEKAAQILENGIILFPKNNDLKIFLRDINALNEKVVGINRSHSQNEQVRNNMDLGVIAYSKLDYQNALKYFQNVIDINPEHGLSKYYINKISVALGENNLYIDKKMAEDALIYERIAEAISLYNQGYYWDAYDIFREVYLQEPSNIEVLDYYNLTISKIKLNDFFINEIDFFYNSFISDIDIPDEIKRTTNPIRRLLAFPIYYNNLSIPEFLKLPDNKYLHSMTIRVFDEIYFFDTILIDSTNIAEYQKYRFGKIVQKNDNLDKYDLILKGKYNSDGTYNSDDTVFEVVALTIDPYIFNISEHIMNKNYISVLDTLKYLKYMPNFGYDEASIIYIIMHKSIKPLILMLLCVLISYYSVRYRPKKKPHPFHIAIGIIGTLIITSVIIQIYDLIMNVISTMFGAIYSPYIVFAILLLLIIIFYSFQFIRIKIED